MQYISVRNLNLRWIINGSTLLLGLIAGLLFYVVYKMANKKNVNTKNSTEKNIHSKDSNVKNINPKDSHIRYNNIKENIIEENIIEDNVIKGNVKDNDTIQDNKGIAAQQDSEAAVCTSKEDSKAQDNKKEEENIIDNSPIKECRISIEEEKEVEEVELKDVYIKFAQEYILTKRETQIGYLVFNRYTNQQIAQELFISETTVKKHLTHIYEKTETSGRVQFHEKIKNYGKNFTR